MSGEIHQFGEFRFVPSARELWRRGHRVALTRRTFECLDYLIANRDRAVGRDELVAAIFGRPNVSDAQLCHIVLRTRRVVDDDGNAQHAIRTIPGFGYRWVADVHVSAEHTTGTAESERNSAQSTHIDAAATKDLLSTSMGVQSSWKKRQRLIVFAMAASLLVIA